MKPPKRTHIKQVPAEVTIMILSKRKKESKAIPVIGDGGP
jgi:hypothetical protein